MADYFIEKKEKKNSLLSILRMTTHSTKNKNGEKLARLTFTVIIVSLIYSIQCTPQNKYKLDWQALQVETNFCQRFVIKVALPALLLKKRHLIFFYNQT